MSEAVYSPGLEGILAGETSVSTIEGGLFYRGYAIEDLARKANFEEVAYLILRGELPNASELADFQKRLGEGMHVQRPIIDFLRTLPNNISLMDVMRSGTSMLAHWDPDVNDNSPEAELRKTERLLAQLPVIMAARHRLSQGKEPINPDPKKSIAQNILAMLFRDKPLPDSWIGAMNVSMILYAEHEFNASTFTARCICSTLSDLHSCITGAIGALKGPLHGGANERVMEVLAEVGSPDNAESWVREQLAKKRRLMGFGHRVYKDGDPRSAVIKEYCQQIAEETGHQDMERMAEVIETIVRDEKGLPPNVDWPSARLYHYMGLPIELYTPLFVIARVVGWAAHVIEQRAKNRLIRPLARYIGTEPREWLPLEAR